VPLAGIWVAGKVPEALATEQRVPPSFTTLSLVRSAPPPQPGAGSLCGRVSSGMLLGSRL